MQFTLTAPCGIGQFQARSGNSYSVSSAGTIVVPQSDLDDALSNGFTRITALTVGKTFATLMGGVTINGLGDSITSGGDTCFPTGAGLSNSYPYPGAIISPIAPQWTALTAFATGQLCQNNGLIFRASSGGATGNSGPTGSGGSDGSVTWAVIQPNANKGGQSFLAWAEFFSNGLVNLDLSQGFGGISASLHRVIVTDGGHNYSPLDTVTFNNGATGTLTVSNGVITAVNITNGGYTGSATAFTVSVKTSTGSGATFSNVWNGTGTFGITSCTTTDMIAFLPYCVESVVDIFTVHGGTNDLQFGNYSTITNNLRTCYETLINAGKKVVAIPILPRAASTSAAMENLRRRVNRWIRSYCRKESWANPKQISDVVLVDVEGYFTDGTSSSGYPIGGTGAANGMLVDGLHPSSRGAQYIGYEVALAAQQWLRVPSAYTARDYSQVDGYDPTYNPGGNMLEGCPWQANMPYSLGAMVANDTSPIKVYYCVQAGTSAGSGGPTGTGSNVTDGGAKWTYVNPAGISTFNSGTSGSKGSAAGITSTGTLASGWNTFPVNSTAAGSITYSIENPWSNGQIGKRQVIAFSLGSGSNAEVWNFYANFNQVIAKYGILNSDLGTMPFYGEMELELSGVANVNYLTFSVTSDSCYSKAGPPSGGGTSSIMNSSGEMVAMPNNGKILLRTQPIILPLGTTFLYPVLMIGFNASGGADSATLTLKVNKASIKRAFVA